MPLIISDVEMLSNIIKDNFETHVNVQNGDMAELFKGIKGNFFHIIS